MKRSRLLAPTFLGAAVAVAIAVFGLPEPSGAEAQRGLRAKIYLTQARVPPRLSERGLIRFARSHRARRLRESTEDKLEERSWLANMVAVFNRPPNDHEFQILYYDIESGSRNFIRTESIFVSDRSQKTYLQRVRLERPQFKPNRKMELVVTVRRQEVGKARFDIVGERKRHSGEVSFSDEEAR